MKMSACENRYISIYRPNGDRWIISIGGETEDQRAGRLYRLKRELDAYQKLVEALKQISKLDSASMFTASGIALDALAIVEDAK